MMDRFYIAGFVLVLSLLLFLIIYLSIKLCCAPRQPNFEQTETVNFANESISSITNGYYHVNDGVELDLINLPSTDNHATQQQQQPDHNALVPSYSLCIRNENEPPPSYEMATGRESQ